MRYLFILPAVLFSLAVSAQKKLVIIGSSTSACFNVNSVTECYVGRLDAYWNKTAPLDTIVDNGITLGGTNCYNGMPTSYTSSPYGASFQPMSDNNITKALQRNPSVILVNYPTNGYDVLPVADIMFCLRTIRDSANAKGIPCFVTTSQPRTSGSFGTSAVKAKLAEIKDSVLEEFGAFAIDFYTGLINPADSSILYDSGDGIHMNATGHQELFQRVLAKNLFLSTLPASFLQVNAQFRNNSNIVSWTTTREADIAYYEVQRSADGSNFSRLGTLPPSNQPGNNQYSYADQQPLKGWNYYKIVVVDKDGRKTASSTMSIRNAEAGFALNKVFASSATQVLVDLQSNEPQRIHLQLYNSMGKLVSSTQRTIAAGASTLYLATPQLTSGIYHISVNGEKGSALIKTFIKN